MSDLWWTVPGPAEFVQQIAEDVGDGKNVVVLVPQHAPFGLADATQRAIRVPWHQWFKIEATDPSIKTVATVICEELQLGDHEFNAKTDIPCLLSAPKLWGAVIWVSVRDSAAWNAWQEFAREFASARRAVDESSAPIFIFELIGEVALSPYPTDVNLSVQRYRGQCDHVDMALYAALGAPNALRKSLTGQTAIAVIAALASWDPGIAERLWDEPPTRIMHPRPVLENFAQDRGWDDDPAIGGALEDPDLSWALGLSDSSRLGMEPHLAARIAVDRQSGLEDMASRIWRGQISAVFPFLETQRIKLIRQYGTKLRLPHTAKRGYREEVLQRAEHFELGDLYHQLDQGFATWPTPAFERVRLLVSARNQLAHLKSIDPSFLARLETDEAVP